MNKIIIIITFVLAYLAFTIASLPAAQVITRLTLPNNIQIAGVSGTIWEGKLQQLAVDNTVINNVNWQLSFWSLFTFDPVVDTQFGGGRYDGPEGHAQLSGLVNQQVRVTDAEVLLAANDVVSQLPMPIPLTAAGMVKLTLPEFQMGKPICQVASGRIDWNNAEVSAFQEDISLQDINATLGCEEGALAVTINPENILGLEFKAYVRNLNQVTGTGQLTPGVDFPQKLKPALPFIGRADSRGRYRLKI